MSALSAGSEREPVPFATGRQRKSSYVSSALHQRSQRSPLIRRNETSYIQAQGPMPRTCACVLAVTTSYSIYASMSNQITESHMQAYKAWCAVKQHR
jgi:hypothetical protein